MLSYLLVCFNSIKFLVKYPSILDLKASDPQKKKKKVKYFHLALSFKLMSKCRMHSTLSHQQKHKPNIRYLVADLTPTNLRI